MVHSKNAIGKHFGVKIETLYFFKFWKNEFFRPNIVSHKSKMSDFFSIFD